MVHEGVSHHSPQNNEDLKPEWEVVQRNLKLAGKVCGLLNNEQFVALPTENMSRMLSFERYRSLQPAQNSLFFDPL